MKKILLEAEVGARITASGGDILYDCSNRMSSLLFYHALPGSKLILKNKIYSYAVATYSLQVDEKFIYTYCYQSEESWTKYNHDLTGAEAYQQGVYYFEKEVYFRICLKRLDEQDINKKEGEEINNIIEYYKTSLIGTKYNAILGEEAKKISQKIIKNRGQQSLVIALITDSHRVINGTWKNTIQNLRLVSQQSLIDAIVHLGDLTDGILPKKTTSKYVHEIMKDIEGLNIPFFMTLGNHDTNYFAGNSEVYTEEEMKEVYLSQIPKQCLKQTDSLYYYKDFETVKIRAYFLMSFDPAEKIRYGYDKKQIKWLEQTLDLLSVDYNVIIFSHTPPMERLDYWSSEIRGENEIMRILECFQKKSKGRLLAFIHGHTHADMIYRQKSFPVISILCNKCEYFEDKKPEGAKSWYRELGTVTEDAWDVLVINRVKDKFNLQLIRFGAGEDRVI